MTPLIILAALFILPVVLLMVFKINASIIFLTLCVGYMLVQFLGADVSALFNATKAGQSLTGNSAQLVLLLAPAVLTLGFMIKTVKGVHLLFNILPAITVGLLAVILIVPLLSPGLSGSIMGSSSWNHIQHWQVAIVGLSTSVNLLFLWLHRPKVSNKHGRTH